MHVAVLMLAFSVTAQNWRAAPVQKDAFNDGEIIQFAVLETDDDADTLDDGTKARLLVACENERFGILINARQQLAVSGQGHGRRTLQVRFDDGPIERWTFSEDAPGSAMGDLFAHSAQELAVRLLKAKRLRIEAFTYRAGRRVLDFDVSGFDAVMPKVATPCGLSSSPK
jgi:hypothetical protein